MNSNEALVPNVTRRASFSNRLRLNLYNYCLFHDIANSIFRSIFHVFNNRHSKFAHFCFFGTSYWCCCAICRGEKMISSARMMILIKSSSFIGPLACIPVLLFAGFFVPVKNIVKYLRWISYTSYGFYSFDALVISIYGTFYQVPQREDLFCSGKDLKKLILFFSHFLKLLLKFFKSFISQLNSSNYKQHSTEQHLFVADVFSSKLRISAFSASKPRNLKR